MNIPPALHAQIDQALREVAQHPTHQFLPLRRQQVYQAIGPYDDPIADQVRGWLQLLTGRHVLPLWEGFAADLPSTASTPDGGFMPPEFPRKVLDTIELILRGSLPRIGFVPTDDPDREDEDIFNAMYEWVGARGGHLWLPNQVWFALGAIYKAEPIPLANAPWDHGWPGFPLRMPAISPGETDDSLPSIYLDTPGHAARANAILTPATMQDRAVYDPSRREEFWIWWLTTAIPQAWQQAAKTRP